MRTDSAKTIYLKDYHPPVFFIDLVELEFELQEEMTRVTSLLHLRKNPISQEQADLVLDGENLELLYIALDGRELSPDEYCIDDHSLSIPGVGEQFVLKTQVGIRPRDNTALEGLYRSGCIYCTQCEAEGFRRITYYLDRPDVMAKFITTIVANKTDYPVLLSNGNCVDVQELDSERHLVRWVDPFPKPCYLFALVAGNLRAQQDVFTTVTGRQIDLRIYVEPENIDKCDHAMMSLKQAMAWDEQQYGREYDLDIFMIVAVNDFNMGAMENKGLNVFNSKFVLARSDTATDNDFQRIAGVIAHEYFHNWTGNRITCRDWFQLSLKEGLTVFRDQAFSADMGSSGVKRIEDVRLLRNQQFAEDASPIAHPVRPESYIEINNFYTATVYEKGAEVVRMQANLLGPELFRGATDLYFERYDGQAVTTDDFVTCMEDASGRDLSQFRLWYAQAGTPKVSVETSFIEAQGIYQLRFTQHTPKTPGQTHKSPFHIPITVALLDRSGKELPLQQQPDESEQVTQQVLELRENQQTFQFHGIHEPPIPSLLRGFSAPIILEYDYRDEELMFLMARDQDDFNRWDAAHSLAHRVLQRLIVTHQEARSFVLDEGFAKAFRLTLTDAMADKALLSELLTLPCESSIGDQMEQVPVESIHQARQWLKKSIANCLHETLIQIYQDNQSDGYAITSQAIACRRLKNLALNYLMTLEEPEIDALCFRQFECSDNMTDVMAALSCLTHRDIPERESVLAAFEKKWRDDPLVMDKWFAVQAQSQLPGTLSRVVSLMEHPSFSIRNPNKVRSLIGVFCSGNPMAFHAADGSGYHFLADQVMILDGLNPQIAARLLRIMSRWRRYDHQRQSLMHKAFERVLAIPNLSRDVFEIASKCIAD
jgi:aminopeptidase N